MRYEIQAEQKGDKVVVRWDVMGIPASGPPDAKETCLGQGLVTLPIAVYNHIATSPVIEDEG